MVNVLLLCGGLGTRLYHYTNSLYPKILLSMGGRLFLDEVINFWFNVQGIDNMILVFSEDNHISIINDYINEFYPDLKQNIKIVKYSQTDGTFNTLFYVLASNTELSKSPLFISWSDILPLDYLDYGTDNLIYTDTNMCHRYLFTEDNEIILSKNGNIPGLYYFNKLEINDLLKFKSNNINSDFIECLSTMNMKSKNIEILDIGDHTKYGEYLSNTDLSVRWFNKIEFTKDKVIKKAANEYGQKIMDSEIAFYDFISQYKDVNNSFPKIYSLDKHIEMENLKSNGYLTVHEYLNSNSEASYSDLLNGYNKSINKLHENMIFVDNIKQNIFKEYIQVTLERYSKIHYFIPKNIKYVNGYELSKNFHSLIDTFWKFLDNRHGPVFWLIHGDTNTTNTMYNPNTNEIKFIDPRGKFGDSMYFGDKYYDIAKFIYGLTGYDKFNLDKYFTFDISGDEIIMDTVNLDLLNNLCDNMEDGKYIKLLVGLIWLKLPYYIRNNPNKIIASYFTGMRIMDEFLKSRY